MRVTNNMIIGNMLRNLNRGLQDMERYNHQLSTGKRIRYPSDDPGGTTRAMYYRSQLVEVDQYVGNIRHGLMWLEETDSALGKVGDVLNRARDLALQGANDVLTEQERKALAEEVNELLNHLVQLGNTSVGGRYIFGGQRTNEPPYKTLQYYDGANPPQSQGDDAPIEIEIAPAVKLAINVTGKTLLDPMFETLIDLRDALKGEPSAPPPGDIGPGDIGGELLGRLDEHINQLLQARAEVGARYNRLETTNERFGDLEVSLKSTLSDVEDLDVARAIMELKMQENVYRLALAATARIIQPTLMDFLR